MKIGNIEVESASSQKQSRLPVLLWGDGGIGKTTFACTAPGRKLLINLDPDGPMAIKHRGDVDVLDLAPLSTSDVLLKLKSDNNPLGLDAVFAEGKPKYETVILDSLTALSERALEDVVKRGVGSSKRDGFIPSMETPGLAAYGGRNAIVLTVVKGLLRVTGRYGLHCIFISHESDPEKDKQGNVLFITMQLGGKLVTSMVHRISEVWWLHEGSAKNTLSLAIKPCRTRKPMKTRMFNTSGEPEFPLKYDYEKWNVPSNNPIAQWWTSWEKGKGAKLALPK